MIVNLESQTDLSGFYIVYKGSTIIESLQLHAHIDAGDENHYKSQSKCNDRNVACLDFIHNKRFLQSLDQHSFSIMTSTLQ